MKALSKKQKIIIGSIVAFVCVVGCGVWYYLGHTSSEPVYVYPFEYIGMTEYWGDSQESYGPVSTDKIQTVFLTDTQIVTEICVKEGDMVKKGDLLMTFDTTLSDLALERKRLEVEKLKLQLQEARKQLQEINNMEPMETPDIEVPDPTDPDLGESLHGDYQISTVTEYDGSSKEKSLICWLSSSGETEIDRFLFEEILTRAEIYQTINNEEETVPETTEETVPETTTVPIEEIIETEETEETEEVEEPTEEETEAPTEKPTEAPTEAPTEKPTEAPTEKPTEAPTEKPTEAPTEKPTEAPTEAPTEKPTEAPTETSSDTPTETPTETEAQGENQSSSASAVDGDDVGESGGGFGDGSSEGGGPGDGSEEGGDPGDGDSGSEGGGSIEVDECYVIFKITAGDTSRGPILTWQGMQIRRDGSFRFFDATGIPDHTLADLSDELPELPEIDFGSGFTAAQIAQMRSEQEKTIRDLDFKIKMADAEYKIMQTEMEDGNVHADIDGKVISVLTEEDAKANQQPLLKVSGGGGFYVEGSVNELDKDSLRIGQEVTINDWRSGGTYTGTIQEVGDFPTRDEWNGMSNPNSSYYPFRVFVDESADLQAGSYVSVMYSAGASENGIYLSNPYVRTEKGRSYVMVQGKNGRLEQRFVVTGKALWGSYTEILSGLTPEDKIAFPYGKNVKPGVSVQEGDLSNLYG